MPIPVNLCEDNLFQKLEQLNEEIESWVGKIEAVKDSDGFNLQPYLNGLTFAMARRIIIQNKIDIKSPHKEGFS